MKADMFSSIKYSVRYPASWVCRAACDLWLKSGSGSAIGCQRSGALNDLPLGAIRIVLLRALVVKDHGGACGSGECRPVRKAAVVGIAGARKLDPCLAHACGQRARNRTAASQIFRAVRVVEAERQVDAVNGAGPAIELWRLPLEPVEIRRRALRC